MTTTEPRPEDHLRRLPLPSDAQAGLLVDDRARRAQIQEITAMPVTEDRTATTATPRPRHRRRVVALATAASLGVATLAGASALWRGDSQTRVACHVDGSVAVVAAVTGDPVADCAAEWQLLGAPAPDLAAYGNGSGGIEVVPAGSDVPAGWTALEPGTTMDTGAIEVEAALADVVAGLHGKCHDTAAARTRTDGVLADLGLDGWSVTTSVGDADGDATCAIAVVTSGQVDLVPVVGVVSTPAVAEFAAAVREGLDGCPTTDDLAALVRDEALAAGLGEAVVHQVADPDADCASVTVTVGGRVEATVRG